MKVKRLIYRRCAAEINFWP